VNGALWSIVLDKISCGIGEQTRNRLWKEKVQDIVQYLDGVGFVMAYMDDWFFGYL
jgi:hypothetical protein